MKLIVNADDFGMSKGINLGIIEAHRRGIITSTTLMTNMPAFENAVALAKENIGLGVGIHLVLTTGRPLCNDVPSLVDSSGNFYKNGRIPLDIDVEDIKKEFVCQIQKFMSYGMIPTHIDSHHHVHMQDKILPVVLELAEKYNLPIRLSKERLDKYPNFRNIKVVENFIGDFYDDKVSVHNFCEILENNKNCKSLEIMSHPAYVDNYLLKNSSYNVKRAEELNVLTDGSILEFIQKNNIELTNYKGI